MHRVSSVSLRLVAALLLAGALPLPAAVLTVDATCTLAAAIAAANADAPVGACPAGSGADTIRLTAAVVLDTADNVDPFTVESNGLPLVTSTITLEGNGFDVARDLLAPDFRILHVAPSGNLTVRDSGFFFGKARAGAGIVNRGRLTLIRSTVAFNLASSTVGTARGGGIYNHPNATLRIVESWLAGNTAQAADGGNAMGGAIYNDSGGDLEAIGSLLSDNSALDTGRSGSEAEGGGIATLGPTRVSYSTFAENTAESEGVALGGGLFSQLPFPEIATLVNSTFSGNRALSPDSSFSALGGAIFGDAAVRHVTFHGNEASDGGGAVWSPGSPGVQLSGSLFNDSIGGHCGGTLIDLGGGNLADDTSCLATIAGTLTGLDPALADNGGPTPTHALLAGSPAIDLAGDCGLGVDQRGGGRLLPCDSGAYEDLGCALQEILGATIAGVVNRAACNTAIVGGGTVVEGPFGSLRVIAGHLITVTEEFTVESGAEARFTLDPALLP